MATVTPTVEPIGRNDLVRRGMLALAGALLAMLVIRVIAGVLLPIEGVEPMSWPAIIGATAVAAIVATIVYGALSRFTANARRNFLAVAGVVLVLSMGPVVTVAPSLPGVTTGIVVVLGVMHVVAAAVIVAALLRA